MSCLLFSCCRRTLQRRRNPFYGHPLPSRPPPLVEVDVIGIAAAPPTSSGVGEAAGLPLTTTVTPMVMTSTSLISISGPRSSAATTPSQVVAGRSRQSITSSGPPSGSLPATRRRRPPDPEARGSGLAGRPRPSPGIARYWEVAFRSRVRCWLKARNREVLGGQAAERTTISTPISIMRYLHFVGPLQGN